MDRRTMLKAAVLAAAGVATGARAVAPTEVRVYKSPSCGCCTGWVAHMTDAGFKVKVEDVGNTAARRLLGIPAALGSCHTAEVAGYAIEGHVPATEVRRLLAERPRARGLAVPGMPIGSPGMEDGNARDAYDVLLVKLDGTTSVFKSYPARKSA